MSTSRAVVAALASVAALIAAAAPAHAVIRGERGWIFAFDSRASGDADLFLAGPGKPVSPLHASVPGFNDARPSWAPEAVMDVATDVNNAGEIVHLQDIPGEATWKKRVNGQGFHGQDYFPAGAPRPAPRPLVTSVTVDGHPVDALVRSDTEIWLKNLPPATNDATAIVCVRKRAGIALAPTFTVASVTHSDGEASPAGTPGVCPLQPVAFQSDRTGDYEIWLFDPSQPLVAGRNPVNLTRAGASHETAPAWSTAAGGSDQIGNNPPPSPLLAFESDRNGNRDIFVLDPALPLSTDPRAPNPAPLTTSPADDANPDWSPDGESIVFESDRLGPKDIWTVQVRRQGGRFLAEQGARQLTADEVPAYDPSWGYYDSTAGDGVTPPTDDDGDVIPDGAWHVLAFAGPEQGGTGCRLNTVAWQGTSPPPVAALDVRTVVDRYADAPAFSSGGEQIAADALSGVMVYGPIFDPLTRAWRPVGTGGTARHASWQPTLFRAIFDPYRPIGRKHKRRKRRSRATLATDAPCATPPEAAFRTVPEHPRAGQRVLLSARRSTDQQGPIDAYEWDFDGDGRFEVRTGAPDVRHVFKRSGRRSVTLRVVDQDGATERARRDVAVGAGSTAKCRAIGGRNVVPGGSGDDVLRGTSRSDVICGFGGDDVIIAGRGRDIVFGGRGRDRVFGGPGRDRLYGQRGADRLRARDGRRDLVSGGRQRDRARIDRRLDRVVGVEAAR